MFSAMINIMVTSSENTARIPLRLSPHLKKEIERLAKEKRRSTNSQCIILLTKAIEYERREDAISKNK
jgi:hypothetical protein